VQEEMTDRAPGGEGGEGGEGFEGGEGGEGGEVGEDFEYGDDGEDAEDATNDSAAERGVTNQFGVTIAPPKKPLSYFPSARHGHAHRATCQSLPPAASFRTLKADHTKHTCSFHRLESCALLELCFA
jgi:hypothetical protein